MEHKVIGQYVNRCNLKDLKYINLEYSALNPARKLRQMGERLENMVHNGRGHQTVTIT